MKKIVFIIIFICCFIQAGYSQTFSIFGQCQNSNDNSSLLGVNVVIFQDGSNENPQGSSTNSEGKFFIKNVKPGKYTLKVQSLGFANYQTEIEVSDKNLNLGLIRLTPSNTELNKFTIEEQMLKTTQKGDTTEYNAKGYKVNRDATAEDLVTKMPGITMENGTVKAHGEEVKKVTVDGQDFFGDDAAMALKNIPAEMVDKVQVFDRMSDQAQFTGFDDGNSSKAINIITANGKNSGVFGKLYAGYGTNERYSGGGNINIFDKQRRITLIGMTNNINQQNFSSQDLTGIAATTPQGTGMFGGRGGGGMGGPPSQANNFLVGQQGGINATNSGGLNYSDLWGKKVKVTGSYFFNHVRNDNETKKARDYFLTNNSTQQYAEQNNSNTNNFNHRVNLRLEYTIDTLNSIILTPKLNFQNNKSSTILSGINERNDTLVNQTANATNTRNDAYTIGNNLLYRHKFRKTGRTLSINLNTDYNYRTAETFQDIDNEFYGDNPKSIITSQKANTMGKGYTLSSDISYTEPLSKIGMIMFSYAPNFTVNETDRKTNLRDTINGEYDILNNLLSNNFRTEVLTQRFNVGVRIRSKKLTLMTGFNYQNIQFNGQQLYPINDNVFRVYDNILPGMFMTYKFSQASNLRVTYRASTNIPNVSQLQNIIDNSNPLLLTTGNPSLRQEFAQNASIRYTYTNSKTAHSFFVNLSGNYTGNYIGSYNLIALNDTILPGGLLLSRGSQLSKRVNLNSLLSSNLSMSYGLPLNFIKSNLNINLGGAYNQTPSLINELRNNANTYNLNGGIVLGSNISEKVDFTVTYMANYNIVQNTLQKQADNNYFYQLTAAKINVMPWKGLVLNTNLTHTFFSGLGTDFNQNYLLWNASIGYKFLKGRAAEIKLTAFDLLNQNINVSRIVNSNYIEDSETRVLRQYFLLSFTYNLRFYKKS